MKAKMMPSLIDVINNTDLQEKYPADHRFNKQQLRDLHNQIGTNVKG